MNVMGRRKCPVKVLIKIKIQLFVATKISTQFQPFLHTLFTTKKKILEQISRHVEVKYFLRAARFRS